MGKAVDLLLRIKGDASKAIQAGRQVEATNSRMTRSLRGVQTAGRVAGRVLAVGISAGALALAAGTHAAIADQAAQSKLAATMVRTAHATSSQVKSVEAWIDRTQRATGVADDELRPALGKLVSVTGNVSKAQRELKVAMNISAGTGKSLASVTQAISKAQNGSTAGLAKYQIRVKDAKGKLLSFHQVMKNASKTFGGAAAKAAETAAGKTRRMKIAYDEALETIGGKMIPVVTKLVTVGTGAINWATNNGKAVKILAGSVLGFVAAVFVIGKAISAWTAVTRAATAVQAVFNAVVAANPITLVIIAIIALVAGLILAYKHSARFRAIVQAVGRVGQRALGWVVSKTSELVGWIRDKVPAAFNAAKPIIITAIKIYTFPLRTMIGVIIRVVQFIGRIPGAFEAAKNKAIEIGDKLLAPFRAVRDMIQSIIDKISKIHVPHVDLNPFNRVSASGFPQLAAPGFGGTTVNITITGTMLDPDGVAKAVEKVTARRFRRLGG